MSPESRLNNDIQRGRGVIQGSAAVSFVSAAYNMNITSAAIFLCMLAALGVALFGLLGKQRSAVVGLIAAVVAFLAAGGAWYAWAESESIPWTIGYGIVVVGSLASALRQFIGGRSHRP